MTPYRFLQITKGEHAQRPLRAKAWLLRTIGEIYAGKRKADAVAIRENFELLPLPEFIYHEYLPSKLGIKDLVDAVKLIISQRIIFDLRLVGISTTLFKSTSRRDVQKFLYSKRF